MTLLRRVNAWRRRHFTMYRWNHNPFQMWCLLLLVQTSANQIFVGVSSNSVVSDYARNTQIALSACNLFGGLICLWALHMRGKITALLIEACGYISLAGSLGIYVWIVLMDTPPPNTSFGLGLSEAFVLASVHRSTIIFWPYLQRLRARRRMSEEVDDENEPIR